MTDLPLPSAFEPPADPGDSAALLDWLTAQEQRIADVVADVTTEVVRSAYRDYLDTLLPDAEPGAVTAAGDLGALDAIPGRWAIAATGRILPELNNMFLAGGIAAWTRSGDAPGAIPPDGWANVVNQNAVQYMAKASNRLTGVGNNVWWGVRSMVRKAVEDGATNEDLKRNIEQMTQFSEFRADAIARTETIGAYNNGNNAGNLALGDEGPAEKWWLATNDDRARPEHVAAQPPELGGAGQVIPYGGSFLVGGVEMTHPHADGAPADQVVNCRCVLMTLYPGDERPDGSTVPQRVPTPGPTPPTPTPPTPPTPTPRPPAKKAAPRRQAPASRIPKDGFATADEAVEFLTREHPTVVWGAGMRKGGVRTLTEIARSSERLAARHPKQWSQLRAVSTETLADVEDAYAKGVDIPKFRWEQEFAHAWTARAAQGEGVIGFNPAWLTKDEAFFLAKGQSKRTGWTIGDGTPGATMTHEFGHLYRYLRIYNKKQDLIDAGQDAYSLGFGYQRPDGKYSLNEMQNWLFDWYGKNRMKNWGSEYGAKNAEEAFAECFAAREFLAAGGEATEGLRKMAAVMNAFDDLVDAARPSVRPGVFDPVNRLESLERIESILAKHDIGYRPAGFKANLKEARDYVKENP